MLRQTPVFGQKMSKFQTLFQALDAYQTAFAAVTNMPVNSLTKKKWLTVFFHYSYGRHVSYKTSLF